MLDTLEGVYDNITQAVASVTDKPITAAVYPHYHADHIGDIAQYVAAAESPGRAAADHRQREDPPVDGAGDSSFPRPTEVLGWPRDSFEFEGADGRAARLRVGRAL